MREFQAWGSEEETSCLILGPQKILAIVWQVLRKTQYRCLRGRICDPLFAIVSFRNSAVVANVILSWILRCGQVRKCEHIFANANTELLQFPANGFCLSGHLDLHKSTPKIVKLGRLVKNKIINYSKKENFKNN